MRVMASNASGCCVRTHRVAKWIFKIASHFVQQCEREDG
jgi:hypothetical protein